jgi:hypothetical protein
VTDTLSALLRKLVPAGLGLVNGEIERIAERGMPLAAEVFIDQERSREREQVRRVMASAKKEPQHQQYDRKPADEVFADETTLVGDDGDRVKHRRHCAASRGPALPRDQGIGHRLVGCALALLGVMHPLQAQDAAALIARHAALRNALASNVFP